MNIMHQNVFGTTKIQPKQEKSGNNGLVWFGLFGFMTYQPL